MQLNTALLQLRRHEPQLRASGVVHASVFGSVARGESGSTSDVDILVELDDSTPIDVFAYARLKRQVGEILTGPVDVVSSRTLRPLLRESILRDAVRAF